MPEQETYDLPWKCQERPDQARQADPVAEGTEARVDVLDGGRLMRQRCSRRIRLTPELAQQIAALADFHSGQS